MPCCTLFSCFVSNSVYTTVIGSNKNEHTLGLNGVSIFRMHWTQRRSIILPEAVLVTWSIYGAASVRRDHLLLANGQYAEGLNEQRTCCVLTILYRSTSWVNTCDPVTAATRTPIQAVMTLNDQRIPYCSVTVFSFSLLYKIRQQMVERTDVERKSRELWQVHCQRGLSHQLPT